MPPKSVDWERPQGRRLRYGFTTAADPEAETSLRAVSFAAACRTIPWPFFLTRNFDGPVPSSAAALFATARWIAGGGSADIRRLQAGRAGPAGAPARSRPGALPPRRECQAPRG